MTKTTRDSRQSMNSSEIKAFIKEHNHLFWYIPEDKKEDVNHELLLETILNYGSLTDIKRLFQLLGFENTIKLFSNLEGRKKLNIYPEIYNFFKLYFSKHHA